MDLTRPEALASLALLPLLWWLARAPRPKREVETAHFLQWQRALARLHRHPLRFRRLRFWLLVAAFTATVFAAAGPRVGARDGPRRLALIVDTSASMAAREPDGTTALSLAQDALRAALPALPAGVELCLATVDETAVEIVRGDAERLRAAVDALRAHPAAGGADLAAIAAATAEPGTAVWTLTDARGATAAPAQGALSLLGSADRANRALELLAVADPWPLPEVRVDVAIHSFPPLDDPPTLRVVGGGRFDPPILHRIDAGRWRAELSIERGPGGLVRIEFGGEHADDQPGDDALRIDLPPPPATRIGVMRASAADGDDWVGRAAALLAELGGGEVVDATAGSRVDLLLVDGGALHEAPGACLSFGTRFGGAAARGTPDRSAPTRLDWRRDHPLTAGLDLSELVVRHAIDAAALPAGEPLIGGEGGGLAVVAADGSLHFAFRLEDSNLPLLAAFPQILRRAFVRIAGDRPTPEVAPRSPAAEADLRRPAGLAPRPLPELGREGRGWSVPFLLVALCALVLRAHLR